MVIRGIPAPLRPMAWQQISHADTRLHQKYSELLRQESSVEKLIARDVQRTFPEEELFQGQNQIKLTVRSERMKVDVLETLREDQSISVKSTVQISPLGPSTSPGHLVGVFILPPSFMQDYS